MYVLMGYTTTCLASSTKIDISPPLKVRLSPSFVQYHIDILNNSV
jgi:hypothetical protein